MCWMFHGMAERDLWCSCGSQSEKCDSFLRQRFLVPSSECEPHFEPTLFDAKRICNSQHTISSDFIQMAINNISSMITEWTWDITWSRNGRPWQPRAICLFRLASPLSRMYFLSWDCYEDGLRSVKYHQRCSATFQLVGDFKSMDLLSQFWQQLPPPSLTPK